MQKRKIIIVGAGFSGLCAAFYLAQNPEFEVTIVEMTETSGGLCYTENINEIPFEHTFRLFSETGYPTVKEVLNAIPSGKKTIWKNLIQVEISFFVNGKIVKFVYSSKIINLEIYSNKLISVRTDTSEFKADHFFYTLNHNTNDLFLKEEYSNFFPEIENVDSINREWDLSLIIGLKTIREDIPIGVVICPESAWSIGFTQYAKHESSTWNYANVEFPESIESFLHILILNTDKGDPKHPVGNKIAKECTKEELLENALYQIGFSTIDKAEIIAYEVDPRWQILTLEEYVKNADKIFSKNIFLSRKQVVVSNTQLYRFKPNEQKYLQNSKTSISNLNFIGECVNGSSFPVPTLEYVAEVSKNAVTEFTEQVKNGIAVLNEK